MYIHGSAEKADPPPVACRAIAPQNVYHSLASDTRILFHVSRIVHPESCVLFRASCFVQQESGIRRQETGDRKQESGNKSQESGDRNQETGIRNQETRVRKRETGIRNHVSWYVDVLRCHSPEEWRGKAMAIDISLNPESCSPYPFSWRIVLRTRRMSETRVTASECVLRGFCHFMDMVSEKSWNAILRDSLSVWTVE